MIVATSNVQGQVIGWDYVADAPASGGLARVAAVVDSLRARYPGRDSPQAGRFTAALREAGLPP